MIIYGVQPRTTTFVDTQAMTDRLRIYPDAEKQ